MPSPFIRPYFLLLLFFSLSTLLNSQPQQFTTWSLEEGLPQSQAYALCEDHLGYLWIGTQGGGICRFDGLKLEVFSSNEGLSSNFVNAILEDHLGRIWAGTSTGLCWFDGKQFIPVNGAAGIPVNALLANEKQGIFAGTQRGLAYFDFSGNTYKALETESTLDRLPVFALCTGDKNEIWIGSQQGIWIYSKGNAAVQWNKTARIAPNPVMAIARSGNRLWFAQLGEGVAVVNMAEHRLEALHQLAGLERTITLSPDGKNALWAGTQATGLFHLTANADSVLAHITEFDGLPHNHVHALLHDHNDRLWIGTSGGGFSSMGALAFRQYGRAEGLPGSRIYALCEDKNGALWVAASQNGLAKIQDGKTRLVMADSGYLQGVKSRTLCEDQQGRIWVGTEGKGVLVIGADTLWRLNRANSFLPSDWVQKIICDPQGNIWIGTASGLVEVAVRDSMLPGTKWYGSREGMPGMSFSALQCDHAGTVWFGATDGTVGYIKNGRVEAIFGQEQGLPRAVITSLVFDQNNRCYVGAKGWGILQGTDRFAPLVTPSPLSSGNIYLLRFDQQGRLWAGTETGVDCIGFEQGKAKSITHFGKNEGFTGIETCQDAVWADGKGQLWFGTMNGLMRYFPGNTADHSKPPLLHFSQVSLFYKPLEASAANSLFATDGEGLKLPWDQNHLSFAFKGIDLAAADELRYRWKLEGPDANWSPWSEQTEVNYANLAPGTYHLLVQATTDGQVLSEPVSARFTIAKPFWELWSFRLAVLGIAALLLFWAVRTYIRNIRRKEAIQREKLEVENRMLQLEQKALQLQMNPHFIFNALNSIQSLIATQDYQVARNEINQFAKLMRGILYNSRKTSISLEEEIETLGQYLHIEQFCQQNAFTFDINTAGLDLENISLPPMLLQPFVENAVVHGVANLPYPGHIQLHFSLRGDLLICTISDNGVGREKAALLRKAKQPGHQSTALAVTQERVDALGGQLITRDLVDEKGQPSGTEVVVEIPVLPEY